MRLLKVLISVLVFYAAVIYPCESRDAPTHDAQPETNLELQSQLSQSHSRQFSSSYQIRRAYRATDSTYNSFVSPKQIQAMIQRGKIFTSQVGDWLEALGFFPVTINIPDVLNGAASYFPSGGGAGSTPRKFFKMLSKMYKDITTDPELKDELKIITTHAAEMGSGLKTFWDSIDFSEEIDAIIKYISK